LNEEGDKRRKQKKKYIKISNFKEGRGGGRDRIKHKHTTTPTTNKIEW
jgi:hypothetical protein